MRPYSLGEITGLVGGVLLHGDPAARFTGVTTDSRSVVVGDLFGALVGERSDGHNFVEEIFRKGAGGAIIEHPVSGLRDVLNTEDAAGRFGLVSVKSTVGALQALARSYRRELSSTVVGITGSVGKTSTKDLVCSVLATQFTTFGNPGNLNSHIGLPLALLAVDGSPQYVVLEMAMRARGEVTELCEIARPHIGILTDISLSHVGVLGSIEEIALAKAEILGSLPPGGVAIASGDNEWVRRMSDRAGRPVCYYGLTDGCDVQAVDVRAMSADGSEFAVRLRGDLAAKAASEGPLDFRLTVPGLHQVHNALAAIAVGFVAGIPYPRIREGLENAVMSPMRLQVTTAGGITIINDAYNASPKSMRSALDLLSQTGSGRKIAVLGDMLEMGDYGPAAHREVGEYARSRASYLACAGDLAREIMTGWGSARDHARDATGAAGSSSWFPDKLHLQRFLKEFLREGDTCLVKASRGMGFESVVASLSGGAEVRHDAD